MSIRQLASDIRPGYLVYIADADARAYVQEFLMRREGAALVIPPDGRFWIDAQLVVGYVDDWSQSLNITAWSFTSAGKKTSGRFDIGETQPWDVVRDRESEFRIDYVIASNKLRMMYQPIVDVSVGVRVLGYEALARAYDANDRPIMPTALFEQARDQNRLFALDRHCCVKGMCSAVHMPGDSMVFINFVPASIHKAERCLALTHATMRENGIDPSRIVFEIVETLPIQNTLHLRRIFRRYRSNGIRFALDDVGAGFNDIAMLEALEPDVVKLDRSIVDGIAGSSDQQAAAERIIAAARQIGACPLAEGIERIEDAFVLRDMGYLWQQGFLYGKPSFDVLPARIDHLDFAMAA